MNWEGVGLRRTAKSRDVPMYLHGAYKPLETPVSLYTYNKRELVHFFTLTISGGLGNLQPKEPKLM